MSPEDVLEVEEAAREFETLVEALRVPLCLASDRQVVQVARYMRDDDLLDTLMEARRVARGT